MSKECQPCASGVPTITVVALVIVVLMIVTGIAVLLFWSRDTLTAIYEKVTIIARSNLL